jgi:hypothetical protein
VTLRVANSIRKPDFANKQEFGRGIPGGLSRSNAPHICSAKVNVQRSDDRECQAKERVRGDDAA